MATGDQTIPPNYEVIQFQKEIVAVIQIIPQDRIPERIVEQTVDAPGPQGARGGAHHGTECRRATAARRGRDP